MRDCDGCGAPLRNADILCPECQRKLPPQLKLDISRSWATWAETGTPSSLDAYTRCVRAAITAARARHGGAA